MTDVAKLPFQSKSAHEFAVTDAGNISNRVAPRQFALDRAPKLLGAPGPRPVRRTNALAAWLALVGAILPYEMQIYLAGAKFTPGRIGITLLLIPALFILSRKGRRAQLSDFFACATAAWMVGAAIYTGGVEALPSTIAESLEFLGAYLVARAFFWGPEALHTLIQVLKVVTITAVVLGIMDSISGRLIVHETFASIFHVAPPVAGGRHGMVRAVSTFEHEIQFGVFCSVVAAVFIYSESSVLQRTLLVGLCFIGSILSWSSAALISILIVLSAYTYDRLARQFPWRWVALWITGAAVLSALILVSNDPMSWLIRHFTLDQQSANFRILIWNIALAKISDAPFTGFAFNSLDNYILNATVDCVWLVFALRFGVPMILFLFLANMGALLPTRQSIRTGRHSYADAIRPAFTMVIILFMFTGLTVHFWNYMWIFWGLCLGIRASLRELEGSTSVVTAFAGLSKRRTSRAWEALESNLMLRTNGLRG
jgi:hypothetical protein